jgi:hypothetical protein
VDLANRKRIMPDHCGYRVLKRRPVAAFQWADWNQAPAR